jgi:hypothetical protein
VTPLYQTIIAFAVLAGITALAVLRIVNADAAVGVFFTILGYVFGVSVPSPLQRRLPPDISAVAVEYRPTEPEV